MSLLTFIVISLVSVGLTATYLYFAFTIFRDFLKENKVTFGIGAAKKTYYESENKQKFWRMTALKFLYLALGAYFLVDMLQNWLKLFHDLGF